MGMSGINPAIVQKVNGDIARVVAMPDVVEKMAGMAIFPRPLSVPQFAEFVASERSRWEKGLRDVGAQPQ